MTGGFAIPSYPEAQTNYKQLNGQSQIVRLKSNAQASADHEKA